VERQNIACTRRSRGAISSRRSGLVYESSSVSRMHLEYVGAHGSVPSHCRNIRLVCFTRKETLTGW
jgi:hypothetical protein